MANIGSLVADLQLNSAEFNRNLKKAEGQTKSFASKTNRNLARMEQSWKRHSQQLTDIRKRYLNLNVAIGTLAGSAGLGLLIKNSINVTSEIKRNAEMAGVGVEAFQELAYAAGQYQVTNEALTDGLKELALRTDEYVTTGAGSAKEALERLGYTQGELNSKLHDTPALLQEIIGRMQGLDQAAQIRIADEIFGGQGGEQFVSMIRAGAGAFSDLRTEAYELGIVIEKDLVEESVRARDTLDSLGRILWAQVQSAVAEIAPDIADMAGDMRKWVKENREFIAQDIPRYLGNIAAGMGKVATAMGWVSEKAAFAGQWWAEVFYGPADTNERTKGRISELKDEISTLQKHASELRGELEHPWAMKFFTGRSVEQVEQTLANVEKEIASRKNQIQYLEQAVDLQNRQAKGAKKTADSAEKTAEETKKQVDTMANAPVETTLLITPKFKKPSGQPGLALDKSMLDEYRNLYEQTRKPIENLYTDLDRLNELWDAGAFGDDKDTYFRAIEMYGEKFSSTFDTVQSEASDTFDLMRNAFDGWANQYSSQLNDMLWDSELTFDGILESFGRMVTEMLIQSAMADVTGALFGSKGGGSGSGWVGTAVSAIGSYFASEKGNAFANGRHIEKYARGGIVDRPTVFPMARGAGLMGEAGPEGILPLTRTKSGDLGVKAEGRQQQTNYFNVTVQAPDGNISKESQRQLQRRLTRSVAQANRRTS